MCTYYLLLLTKSPLNKLKQLAIIELTILGFVNLHQGQRGSFYLSQANMTLVRCHPCFHRQPLNQFRAGAGGSIMVQLGWLKSASSFSSSRLPWACSLGDDVGISKRGWMYTVPLETPA